MPLAGTEPLQRTLMREEVYDRLLGAIVRLELAPGERINDQVLAEALGVSRTPVREALKRLEDGGLVESVAGRWTRVAPIDHAEAREIYSVVRALELAVLHEVMGRLRPADVRQLAMVNARLNESIAAGEFAFARQLDDAFHDVLIETSANGVLIRTLRGLKLRLARIENAYFRAVEVARGSMLDYGELVLALGSGDAHGARAAMERHWDGRLARYEAWVNAHQE